MNPNLDFFYLLPFIYVLVQQLYIDSFPFNIFRYSWEYVILITQGEEVNYHELDHDKVICLLLFFMFLMGMLL